MVPGGDEAVSRFYLRSGCVRCTSQTRAFGKRVFRVRRRFFAQRFCRGTDDQRMCAPLFDKLLDVHSVVKTRKGAHSEGEE